MNNKCSYVGGGMFIEKDSKATLKLSSFSNNIAHIAGGALAVTSRCVIKIVSVSFAANKVPSANTNYNDTSQQSISDLLSIKSRIQAIIGQEMSENLVGGGGAMFLLSGAKAYIDDSKLSYNMVDGVGAAILAMDSTKTEIHTSTFQENTAELYAGVILSDSSSKLHFYNCKFDENLAGQTGNIIATQMDGDTLFYLSRFVQLDSNVMFSTNTSGISTHNVPLQFQKSAIFRKHCQNIFDTDQSDMEPDVTSDTLSCYTSIPENYTENHACKIFCWFLFSMSLYNFYPFL